MLLQRIRFYYWLPFLAAPLCFVFVGGWMGGWYGRWHSDAICGETLTKGFTDCADMKAMFLPMVWGMRGALIGLLLGLAIATWLVVLELKIQKHVQ